MHPNIRLLKWFNFFTDFKLYAPVAILYFSQISGSFALGMSVFSITMLSSAVFEVPTGVFSDRIGRKRTIVFGSVAALIAVMVYALSGSFWGLALGALFEGLSRALYSGNNDALLHDSLHSEQKEERYGEVLGKLSSFSQIALAISAVFGALLASQSFQIVIWLTVIPQLLCVALSLLLVDVYVRDLSTGNVYSHLKDAIWLFMNNPRLRLLSLSDMLNHSFSESTFLFQSAFYQTVWPVWAIGFAKAASNLGAALGFHFSGWFLKKFSSFGILVKGYVIRRVVTIFGALFPSLFSPLFMIASSIPWAITYTAQNTLLQNEFDSTKRATMASLNSLGGSILFAVFAAALGLSADLLSPGHAIVGIQALSLITLVFYWLLFRKRSTYKNT